jgi:glycerophosphoryl diester phosphodiesterase
MGSVPHTLRLAHRGDWRDAPENSIPALVAAVGVRGCDGVEFDVRLSRDGVPVLSHDEGLSRVHGVASRVADLDASSLVALGVASLADALEALPTDAYLDVELKGNDHGEATATVLRAARGERPTRAIVSSFEPPALAAMVDRLPGWPRWLNAEDLASATLEVARELGCVAVSAPWGAITPDALRSAHAAGLSVAAWTIREPATFDRLARLGVVACCVEAEALEA